MLEHSRVDPQVSCPGRWHVQRDAPSAAYRLKRCLALLGSLSVCVAAADITPRTTNPIPGGTFIPPQWVALTQITDPLPDAGARFGGAVAMWQDILVVGAPQHDVGTVDEAGSAYVFRRNSVSGSWALEATLSHSPQPNAHFGAAVAVAGDNIIVGAPDYSVNSLRGQAVLYRRNAVSGQWQTETSINACCDVEQQFGASVAISQTLAAIGAPLKSVGGEAAAGEVATYEYAAGSWTPLGLLHAANPQADAHLGASLALFESALSIAPSALVAGAPGRDTQNVADAGAVYVFQRSTGDWSALQTLLLPNPGAGDALGTSVALGYQRVFAGSPTRDDPGGNNNTGSVNVFGSNGGNYSHEAEVFATGGSGGARFGDSVAFDADVETDRLLVGAPLGNQGATATDSGSAFVFEPTAIGGAWFQDDRLSLGAAAMDNDRLGSSVAIAGRIAAVGVPRRNVGALANAGIVEIFTTDTIFASGFE